MISLWFVLYSDSLKLFITLYGHTQPVTSVKFSKDSRLILTASGDRDIRLWGTDFGDCQKKIYAHDDTITSISWIGNSHYFFSVSRDGSLKYWDADKNKGTLIQTIGWHGAKGVGDSVRAQIQLKEGKDHYVTGRQPIHGLCVSKNGDNIMTIGGDFAIRVWERTNEIIVLADEKHHKMEDEEDYHAAQNIILRGAAANALGKVESHKEGHEQDLETGQSINFTDEIAQAEKHSADSIKTADKLLEAMLMYEKVTKQDGKYFEEDIQNAARWLEILGYKNREMDYIIDSVIKLPPGELDQACLLLPEYWVNQLGLAFNHVMLAHEIGYDQETEDDVERAKNLHCSAAYSKQTKILIGRAFFNLIKIHYKSLNDAKILNLNLAHKMREFYQNEKKMYNWNLSALNLIQKKIQKQDEVLDFVDKSMEGVKRNKRKRKSKNITAPILSVV